MEIYQNKTKRLFIGPTLRCNYKCEYCTQREFRKETFHDDRCLETAKIIRDVILPVYKPNMLFCLGGEITILNKQLSNIINDFYNCFFYFVTNGSNLDWFLPIKDRNHQITVSIHESQREIDDIIYNIEKYRDLGLNIFPSIVLTKYNSEVVRYVKNKLPELFIQPEINTSKEELETSLINQIMFVNGEKEDIKINFSNKPCKCKSNMLHINSGGCLYFCNHCKGQLLPKHIVEHTKEEIEKAINNVINNPIIDCDSACYHTLDSVIKFLS